MKQTILTIALSFVLTACNYSNEFKGTYNGGAATVLAYSKNINRYCVALTVNATNFTKRSYISASAVFDENDYLKPKKFNTKGAPCSANLTDYLVGERTPKLLGTTFWTQLESVGINYCQYVTYKDYQYEESVVFEIKNNSDDMTIGTFAGKGEVSSYTDFMHPVYYGPVVFCGAGNYPGRGFPGPGPGYPGPRRP